MSEDPSRPPQPILDWFAVEIDPGDAPALHLAGLLADDVVTCFEVLQSHAPRWTNRTFHIDAEQRDVTVQERPDVACLVRDGAVSSACIGADGLRMANGELPLLEMFLYPSAIQFFWWPGPEWTAAKVTMLGALLQELLAVAPLSRLSPDLRYPAQERRRLDEALAVWTGEPGRIDPC